MTELIFGKYEILRRLALGGMGEVFLARQTGVAGFERLVILKSLLPELATEEGFVDQFLDEARVAATLNHPNIVAIYEVGLWNGTYYIAMEHIHGEDLSRIQRAAALAKTPVPLPVAARIAHDAALGLDHAHHARDVQGRALAIVHRDISPHNIMVRGDGVTKVVDFGIAKAANRSTRTATGLLKGKLQYMAPEHVRGEELDGRSDQFALGVVLWELCVGRRLFRADREIDTVERILREPIPRPSSILEGFPVELESVILRMLEREREARFATAGEAARALRSYLESCSRDVGEPEVPVFVQNVIGKELEARTQDLGSAQNFVIPLRQEGRSGVIATPTMRSTRVLAPRRSALVPAALIGGLGALAVATLAALALFLPGEGGHRFEDSEVLEASVQGAPPARAVLALESAPPGATVWLGGRALGTTPLETEALAPGAAHTIVLTRRGYLDATLDLELVPGQIERRAVALQKAPEAVRPTGTAKAAPAPAAARQAEPARLTLNTTPWAKVFIDGQLQGTTPLWKIELAPGRHTLRLVNEGAGLDVTRAITLGPGEHAKHQWTLP